METYAIIVARKTKSPVSGYETVAVHEFPAKGIKSEQEIKELISQLPEKIQLTENVNNTTL